MTTNYYSSNSDCESSSESDNENVKIINQKKRDNMVSSNNLPSFRVPSNSDCESSTESDNENVKIINQKKRDEMVSSNNLPCFRVPGKNDYHHHHHHHHHCNSKKEKFKVLTNNELEAVVATFSTFATSIGVRLRRKDLIGFTNERLADSEISRQTFYKHDKILNSVGDILDKKNKAMKKDKYDMTWRSLTTSSYKRKVSVEIIKQDKTAILKNIDSYTKNKIKTLRCNVCERKFKNFDGFVSRMSVARLKQKWKDAESCRIESGSSNTNINGSKRKQTKRGKSSKAKVCSVDHYSQFACGRAYDLVRVCVFCLQYFSLADKDTYVDKKPIHENQYVENERRESFPEPISSVTLIPFLQESLSGTSSTTLFPKKYIDSNQVQKYRIKYRSTSCWKSFDQEIVVAKRKKYTKFRPKGHSRAASPRKLKFAVSPIKKH
jgi:hypothetical protein